MKNIKYLIILSAVMASCTLQSPPEYSSVCNNYGFIGYSTDNRNQLDFVCYRSKMNDAHVEGDACLEYYNRFATQNLCPPDFKYCLEDPENGNGCVQTCPVGTYADTISENGALRYVCLKNTTENCGQKSRNCEDIHTGWLKGNCDASAECVLEKCRDIYKQYEKEDGSYICVTQNQSCGQKELDCTGIPVDQLNDEIGRAHV